MDHRPILSLEHSIDYGPKPFRFFYSWFNQDSLDKVVQNSWSTTFDCKGILNPWVIFKKKLQLLQSNIRIPYSSIRVGMDSKIKLLLDKIESIDAILMGGDGSANLREQRVFILKELTDLDHLSRLNLNQKAKFTGVLRGMRTQVFFTDL